MKRSHLRLFTSILAWLVFWTIFFSPFLPKSKVLAPLDILETLERPWAQTERIEVWNAFCYDAISQYIPYDYAVYRSLRENGIIGWNPNMHNGTYLRENHMLCPSSLRHIFYRFLPFWDAWDWGRMVHFLLAGIGMIFLLLEARLSVLASILGALAFSFSSQMVVWIHSDVIASGCCWSPWMLWSLIRLQRISSVPRFESPASRSRISIVFAILLAAFFVGVAFCCGFLHTTFFNVSLLAVFLLSALTVSRHNSNIELEWRNIFLAIALGIAISIPWFLEVVPPAIQGGHPLPPHSIFSGIKAFPTLATSIFPTLLGSPQSIDGMKLFGSFFYEVKFAGGTALILASLALFRREAPTLPKILFVLFLAIPFTPLSRFYYHRCFVLSAIGIAWLAAWQIDWQVHYPSSSAWKRILIAFACVCLLWLVASFALQILEPTLLPKLQAYSIKNLPAIKIGRSEWILERTIRFYQEAKIWNLWNITGLFALSVGLVAASHIRINNQQNRFAMCLVVLGTFVELSLFGARIFYPANRPSSSNDSPYPDREWVFRFKSNLGNGSVLFWQSFAKGGQMDFDYMQINAPSACGIRQSEGYESVQPVRLTPLNLQAFDPSDYALAGISHVSTPHGQPFPNANAWRLIDSSCDYDLYANPFFHSIFLAKLADGTEVPIFTKNETPNTLQFELPKGTLSIRLAMTWHPKWRYRLGGDSWKPLPPSSDGYHAAEIVLPSQLIATKTLDLKFR